MKTDNSFLWILVIVLLLAFGGGVIGGNAPFKTDKLSVLIVEETASRTLELASEFAAIEASVKAGGGQFRKLDKDQSDLTQEAQWVQDAWKVKGATTPWMVAANARSGSNAALPAATIDGLKLVTALGGK